MAGLGLFKQFEIVLKELRLWWHFHSSLLTKCGICHQSTASKINPLMGFCIFLVEGRFWTRQFLFCPHSTCTVAVGATGLLGSCRRAEQSSKHIWLGRDHLVQSCAVTAYPTKTFHCHRTVTIPSSSDLFIKSPNCITFLNHSNKHYLSLKVKNYCILRKLVI